MGKSHMSCSKRVGTLVEECNIKDMDTGQNRDRTVLSGKLRTIWLDEGNCEKNAGW